MGFLNNTGLAHLWASIKEYVNSKVVNITDTVGGDTLTWDGDTTKGIDLMGDGTFVAYHLSDAIPPLDNSEVTITYTYNGETKTEESQAGEFGANVKLLTIVYDQGKATSPIVIALCDNADYGDLGMVYLPKKGVYYSPTDENLIFNSLTINGYTGFGKTVVKEECLPDGIATYVKSTGTFDGLGWSSQGDGTYTQTITVNGVTASNRICVAPVETYKDTYLAMGCEAISQAVNSITFSCHSPADSAVVVEVIILDL